MRVLLIVAFFLAFSCKRDYKRTEDSIIDVYENGDNPSVQPLETNSKIIRKVNFYLENSGSMNGYAVGNSNFKKAVVRLLSDLAIEVNQPEDVKLNLVNSKVYPLKEDYQEFNKKLTTKGIPEKGNMSSSDINLMFKKILGKTSSGTISILVTDGIYSIDKVSQNDLLGLLDTESQTTRNHFIERLISANISTEVLKMSSGFNGLYYPAKGGKVKINQERPYYIWIIGEAALIKNVNDLIDLKKLPGYQEVAMVIKKNNDNIDYTITAFGEGKLGKYENCNFKNFPIHCIKFQEAGTYNDLNEFGFAVAANFNDIPISLSFLEDTNNYSLNSEYYDLYRIKKIESESNEINKQTYSHIRSISEKTGKDYSHLMFFRANEKYLQDLEVTFGMPKPDWITYTGTDDDSTIKDQKETTFGFSQLYNGISDAYQKVNEGKFYFRINLTVKN